jgi:hypothetical protein
MHKSNNSGILKWRTWSSTRKCLVLGALIGVLITIVLQGSCLTLNAFRVDHVDEHSVKYGIVYLVVIATIVTTFPTETLASFFGCEWAKGFIYHPKLLVMGLNLIINGILLAVIGWAISGIVRLIARCFKSNGTGDTKI